jgi:hypothetical protein
MNRTTITHHSHSHNQFFHSELYKTYLKPSIYITEAILLLIFASLCHAGIPVAVTGALGIIVLTISRILKSKSGIFFALLALMVMVMIYHWHWVDDFFPSMFSSDFTAGKLLFIGGLAEGLITMVVIWNYTKLLHNLNMRISKAWFAKQTFLKLIRLLFFFQLFLILFWISRYLLHLSKPVGSYNQRDFTVMAGCIALIAACIPSFIYFAGSRGSIKKHHYHRHHRSHRSSNLQKKPDEV